MAAEHGAAGVIVSNHGGRQLDTVLSGADALVEVVDAVGDRLDVLVDGGIRRGHRRAQGARARRASGARRPPACSAGSRSTGPPARSACSRSCSRSSRTPSRWPARRMPGVSTAASSSAAPWAAPARVNILVTGVTGYVGAAVVPRLLRDGHAGPRPRPRVRTGSRSSIAVVEGDAVSGDGLERALDGIDVAYYLIHSMEPSATTGPSPGVERSRRSASRTRPSRSGVGGSSTSAASCRRPGRDRPPRKPARGRADPARARPCSVALRASIVIGARSRSFRFLVRLVERLPVLAVPAWRRQPHATDRRARRDRVAGPRGDRRARSRAVRSTSAGPTPSPTEN